MIKMKSLSLALVCIIALSTFASCAKSPLVNPASGSTSQGASSAPATPSKPAGYYEGDKIVEIGTVLTIGDYEVSFDEFRYVYLNEAAQAAAAGPVDEAALKETCLSIFKEQVAMRTIAAKNDIKLLDEDMKQITDSLDAQRTQAGSDEAFEASLAQSFATEDAYIKMSESQFLFQKYIELALSTTHKAAIIENAEKNYAHVKHVLIMFPDSKKLVDATEEEIKTTKDKANEVVKKINDGMSFEDAMKEYNEDEGQPEEGYTFTTGQMVESFEKKSFELKVGEMSEPVQSEFGYHIIKKYEFNTAEIKDTDLIQYVSKDVEDAIFKVLDAEVETLKVTNCKEWDKISTTTLF